MQTDEEASLAWRLKDELMTRGNVYYAKLSRGNGLLESLSFFAVILGTVAGGVLSFVYQHRETVIGGILVTLAVGIAAGEEYLRHEGAKQAKTTGLPAVRPPEPALSSPTPPKPQRAASATTSSASSITTRPRAACA